MLGVLADHAHYAVTTNHLALVANLLNGCPNLHDDVNSLRQLASKNKSLVRRGELGMTAPDSNPG